MCFAIPLRVEEKKEGKLVMESGRVVKAVLTEDVKIGDYLVCQHDLAVDKVSKEEALKMRRAIKEANDEISRS